MTTTLDRESMVRQLDAARTALRDLFVAEASLFGSVARGEAQAGSDVDLLIAFDEERMREQTGRALSLFHVAKVQALLEDRLGVPVGLTLRRSASAAFLARIEPELQRVA